MRYYELLYIVNPNLENDSVKTIIDEIGNEINKYKVSIINHNLWGKKRLAYPINKNKYGIYLILQFGSEKFTFLRDFERYLVLNKSVIRHQLVKLDEEPGKMENIEPIITEKDPLESTTSEKPKEETDVKLKGAEAEKSTSDTKDTKDTEDTKDTKDTKDAEKTEDKKDAKDIINTKDAEVTAEDEVAAAEEPESKQEPKPEIKEDDE